MTAIVTRLRRLEQKTQSAAPAPPLVFWPDQLLPCNEHPQCEVEPATGAHHENVIHLSFEAPRQ